MGRDLKIGMVVGLVLGGALLVWFSGHSGLGVKAGGIEQILTRSEVNETEARAGVSDLLGASSAAESETPVKIHLFAKVNADPRIHVVQEGETLSEISALYYGSGRLWERILAANRSRIKSADKLVPGMELIIPE